MAEEVKTYIINFEDQLDAYAQRAAEAKKKVDELKESNKALQEGGKASAAEIEKSNATLKAAQSEYRSAASSLQNATKAQKDNKDSYNALYRQWVEAKKALNDMPGAYTKAADGSIQLSDAYKEQSAKVAEAKAAVDDFNLGVHSGTINIANYASALDGVPGPLGQVVGGIKKVGLALKALLANPVVLIIAAITAALTALVKAFKSTDDGATAFNAKLQQIKATLDVLRNVAIDVGQALINVFKGKTSLKEAAAEIKDSFTGIREEIQSATEAANEYAYALDNLENAENNWISRQAELRNAQARARYTAEDREADIGERRKATDEYVRLLMEEVEQNKDFAQQRLDIEAEKLAALGNVDKDMLLRYVTMNDAERANADVSMNELRNRYENEVNELEKLYAAYIDADTEYYQKGKEALAKRAELTNQEKAALESLKTANKEYYEAVMQTINADLMRITQKEAINQDELQINADFNEQQQQQIEAAARMSRWQAEQYALDQQIKIEAAQGALGALASIFGEQTRMGKAAAVAQALINTYQGASMALTDITIPSTIARVALMASVLLTGLANVKNIMAVDSSGGSAISSSASSISTAANKVGYSSSAGGVNTADKTTTDAARSSTYSNDLMAAIAGVRTIVTVEDINAKTAEYNKVEVAANI